MSETWRDRLAQPYKDGVLSLESTIVALLDWQEQKLTATEGRLAAARADAEALKTMLQRAVERKGRVRTRVLGAGVSPAQSLTTSTLTVTFTRTRLRASGL